jgi:hypothetical protein
VSQYVPPEEFLRLLLSRRRLVRADGADGQVRGLLDPQTGTRFLIERGALAQL